MIQIDILIPTYNRETDLIHNLRLLGAELDSQQLWPHFNLIISDNASTDSTQKAVQDLQKQSPDWRLQYFRNAENIGLEANAVQVLGYAQADYVLFLGDDDFLAPNYLQFVVQTLERPNPPATIITGIVSIDQDFKILKDERPYPQNQAEQSQGYTALYEWSHLGNQLSGLVLRRDQLLNHYLAQSQYRNPYLFIFFTAWSLYHGGGIFAPEFKTKVKVLNAKDWSYNDLGLLDEVYKSYYYFIPILAPEQVQALLLRFTRLHAHRFGIQRLKPWALFGQHRRLCLSLASEIHTPSFRKALAWLMFKEYLLAWLRPLGFKP